MLDKCAFSIREYSALLTKLRVCKVSSGEDLSIGSHFFRSVLKLYSYAYMYTERVTGSGNSPSC